MKTKKENR